MTADELEFTITELEDHVTAIRDELGEEALGQITSPLEGIEDEIGQLKDLLDRLEEAEDDA